MSILAREGICFIYDANAFDKIEHAAAKFVRNDDATVTLTSGYIAQRARFTIDDPREISSAIGPLVIRADGNAHHEMWEADIPNDPQGERVMAWCQQDEVQYANEAEGEFDRKVGA